MRKELILLLLICFVQISNGQKPVYKYFDTIEEARAHRAFYTNYAKEKLNLTGNKVSLLYDRSQTLALKRKVLKRIKSILKINNRAEFLSMHK